MRANEIKREKTETVEDENLKFVATESLTIPPSIHTLAWPTNCEAFIPAHRYGNRRSLVSKLLYKLPILRNSQDKPLLLKLLESISSNQ